MSFQPAGAPILKLASATSTGNTAVWTPASGKRFRLMRVCIDVTLDAARSSAGHQLFKLQDGTTDIGIGRYVYIPATAVTTNPGLCFTSGWIDVGPVGYLSGTIGNVLNINLAAALTAGVCAVSTMGTEE